MFERIVWQYWENSPEYPNGIPYIELCHESVDLYSSEGKGYKVIRLNKDTVKDYIDWNPYLDNMTGNSNQLAQKADYIRSKLLCKYGGIWLDSDAIVFNNLESVFDKLNDYEFYGYKIIAPCVWGFACHKNASIMKKWVESNEKILEETKGLGLGLGEFGHRSLRNFMDDEKSFFDEASKVQSIDHRYAWKYMEFTSGIDEYITKEQPFFMLNNAVIYDKFKKMSREEILCSDILLFQFIRRSLNIF